MIKIIVDSTCDLNKTFLKENDVAILPLSVVIEEQAFLDGIEITTEEVFKYMEKGIVPKTSQVRPKDAYALFEDYAKKGYDFIYVSFSSQMSGTYSSLLSILNEIKENYPSRKMEVVDSGGGSVAIGLMVLQLLSYIKQNKTFEEVLEFANEIAGNVEHRFLVGDLGWMAKSGRINKAVAVTGKIMGVKPVLHVEDGKIKMLRIIRGSARQLQNLANMIVDHCKEFTNQIIGISYADNKNFAVTIADLLKEKLKDSKIIITRINSVLSAHIGMNSIGVFFFKNKPSYYDLAIDYK